MSKVACWFFLSLLLNVSLGCIRGEYDSGAGCVPCDAANCPIIEKPNTLHKWAIYFPGCITWNVNDIPLVEETISISLEYGTSYANVINIASNIDAVLENFTWTPSGMFPSVGRVIIKLDSSGDEFRSVPFEIVLPSQYPYIHNGC